MSNASMNRLLTTTAGGVTPNDLNFSAGSDQIPDRLVGANDVRARLGGISDMTLWRWLDSPEVGFPRPIYVRRRRFWRESDLAAWVAAQAPAARVV